MPTFDWFRKLRLFSFPCGYSIYLPQHTQFFTKHINAALITNAVWPCGSSALIKTYFVGLVFWTWLKPVTPYRPYCYTSPQSLSKCSTVRYTFCFLVKWFDSPLKVLTFNFHSLLIHCLF